MQFGGWLLFGAALVILLGWVPLLARRRAVWIFEGGDDRFSSGIRVVARSRAPRVSGVESRSVALHPFSGVAGVPLEVVMARKSELADVIAQRAALRARVSVAASRRVMGLVASLVVTVLLALFVASGVVAFVWLLVPVLVAAGLFAHGAVVGPRYQAQLAQLDERVRVLREQVRAAEGARVRERVKAAREAVAAEAAVAEGIDVVSEGSAVPAGSSSEGLMPESAELEAAPVKRLEPKGTWVPTEMPRPLYQMRATAPRRQFEPAKVPTAPHGVPAPMRPKVARDPQTGALSSEEVAAGATYQFDAETVIERRRAAS